MIIGCYHNEHFFCYDACHIIIITVGVCQLDCSLVAAINFPKYLECPLINTTDEISFSGEGSGLTIINISWDVEYCLRTPWFQDPCCLLHIDHYGISSNHACPSSILNFEVTSSGQLLTSLSFEWRSITFQCSVWNKSTSQWIQSHKIGPLIVLDYRMSKLKFNKYACLIYLIHNSSIIYRK